MDSPQFHSRTGFTLVELSIVLVILGLLVGGVLTGQSLIHAAELRSVSADYARLSTAIYTFRDKYFALPGDMTNATAYWGTDPNGCPHNTIQTTRTTTCDGNGDGQIGGGNYNYEIFNNETFRAPQQLANAGLIEGSYTGVSGTLYMGGSGDAIPGVNVPRAKIGQAGWSMTYYWKTPYAYMPSGNYFVLGPRTGGPTYPPGMNFGDMFKAEDVYNIDTKLDDGMPGTGKVMVYSWYICSGPSGVASDYYYLNTTSSTACGIVFAME